MSAIDFIEWLSTVELYPQYRAWNIVTILFFAFMVFSAFRKFQRTHNFETAFIMAYVLAFAGHSLIDETLIVANLDIVLFEWMWPWPNLVVRWMWRVFYVYFAVRLCEHFGIVLSYDLKTKIALVCLFAYFFLVPWGLYRPWDYRTYFNTPYPLWLVYLAGKGVWVLKALSFGTWVRSSKNVERRKLVLSNLDSWMYAVGKGCFLFLFCLDAFNGFRNVFENLNLFALVIYIHFLEISREGILERIVNRGRRTIIAKLAGIGQGVNIGSGDTRFPNKLNLDLNSSDIDIVADACHLPFRDNSMPNVVMSEVLEHISQREAAISEIHRIIPQKGTLLLSVPQSTFMGKLSSFLFNRHEHHDHFSRREIISLLGGFDVKQCFTYGTLPYLLKIPIGGTLITVSERL